MIAIRSTDLGSASARFAVAFVLGTASSALAAGSPLSYRTVALTGDAAPGTEPGATIGALTTGLNHAILIPQLDEAGRVAFMATLSGPGVTAANVQGMWAEQNGQLGLLARGGLPAPGTGGGVVFVGVPSLEIPFPPVFGGGVAVFGATLSGAGVDVTNDEGTWIGTPGEVTLQMRQGGSAPGLPGVTFSGNSSSSLLQFVSFNDNERAAFQIRLGGAMPTTHVVYSDHTGSLLPVAVPGDPAPGTDFDFSILSSPRLSDADRIAFSAAFPDDDTDPFTPPPFGVFSDVDGALNVVVSPGDITTAGDIIADARLTHFKSAGQMLMNVTVEVPTFRTAVVLRDKDGSLHTVAATGRSFDVAGDGSDVRQIIRAFAGGMNESGEVAVRLDFADSSSGHFVASLSSAGPLGDFDGDGDVDLADFATLSQCFGGANNPPTPSCPAGVDADLDSDGDVDLSDFAIFSQNFTGAN